jgi:transposase-like protein
MDQFAHRSMKDVDYVYLFADGIHFNVRLEEARLCALVIVGVRVDGTKELVSITDGHRESTESWADVLRDLKRRGTRAPICGRTLSLSDARQRQSLCRAPAAMWGWAFVSMR